MKKKAIAVMLSMAGICLLMVSCSTRGVHDQYFGATEQRLLTHSLDQLVTLLPEKDFNPFMGRNIYIECHFLQEDIPLKYALKRIQMEFVQKYAGTLVNSPGDADVIYDFFFTALGTDRDKFGLSTPDFVIPGSTGVSSIDLLSLDMYHGVSELYYYITDTKRNRITRGDRIRSIIRTDKLSLPIISIPITTLK